MSKTVVVTDGRYRSALSAVRMFAAAGYKILVTQTASDACSLPASFRSVHTAGTHLFPCSCKDDIYASLLAQYLKTLDHPILFCVGADSLRTVSENLAQFRELADLLISPPSVLARLNDKQTVQEAAQALGIPVPRPVSAADAPNNFPLVVKPHCGEKFGLKAKERYRIVRSSAELYAALELYRPIDPSPIIQEKITGDGIGVNLLLGQHSELLAAYCHRRLRQYPVSGGPSTCCEAFADEKLIADAHRLLASFGFCGIAMVEYKGDRLLEVNPRVWGSFPLAAVCGSDILARYAEAAAGQAAAYTPGAFRQGAKMRFLYNDLAATVSYLLHGELRQFLNGVRDFFTVPEALCDSKDRKGSRAYLKASLNEHRKEKRHVADR